MSKKRKTRKQKELASIRHNVESIKHSLHIHSEAPSYSISGIKTEKAESRIQMPVKPINSTYAQKDAEYLKHDMVSITAASGIVAAFDVLLFALLTTGVIHLNFLGY